MDVLSPGEQAQPLPPPADTTTPSGHARKRSLVSAAVLAAVLTAVATVVTTGDGAKPPRPLVAPSSSPGGNPILAPAGRPSLGKATAVVTIVEFSDYECTHCGRFALDTHPQLLRSWGTRVRYVARNFPLPELHPLAFGAAEAAECAHRQGKFWEYRKTLFQNQGALAEANLKAYARRLGLSGAEFDKCLDSDQTVPLVQRDLDDAKALGAEGTPTFFVNGTKISGPSALQGFLATFKPLQ